jgi:hypothetical protein
MNPVFAILVTERFADPIVSLPPDAFRKREPVHLRSAITGKIGSPVTIRQPHAAVAIGQKTKDPTNAIQFKPLPAPAPPPAGALGNQDYDFGDILQAGGCRGILGALYAEYALKVTSAGALAPTVPVSGSGAVNPQALSNIILEIDYGIAVPPTP